MDPLETRDTYGPSTLRILTLLVLCSINAIAQSSWQHGQLQVSADKRGLQFEDGKAFFWLGDTAWEIFNKLTIPEIRDYLDNRAAKGFNVIQVTAISTGSISRPNRYGEFSLFDSDPLKPNEKYFALLDSVVRMAMERQLLVAMVAVWGDKFVKLNNGGPVIINKANAYGYGKWLGSRFKKFPNIVWIMGGDVLGAVDTTDYRPVWREIAKGINESTDRRSLMTYHPSGYRSSSQWFHNESWLDFNMIQSSHGPRNTPAWDLVRKDRDIKPVKPTLDSEPNYEDHPVNPWPTWKSDSGYFRDYDVRKQLYRTVFAGGLGVTYGNHAIWQFMSERDEALNYADRGWRNAMDRPGAFQAGYLRKLMESRPMGGRVPDLSIIATGQGSGAAHAEAFRGGSNDYAMIYLPIGKSLTVNTSFMKTKRVNAWWYNPRNGEAVKIGALDRLPLMKFITPSTGLENDWVLVLDDAFKNFNEPGK